jgi:hypothetical protein
MYFLNAESFFMKKLWGIFFLFCGLCCTRSDTAKPPVELKGVLVLPNNNKAVIQSGRWTYILGADEAVKGAVGIEVVKIDLTNVVVKTSNNDDEHTYDLRVSPPPATARSWIHLQDVDFQQAVEIFGKLTGRTMLIHPRLTHTTFTCDCNWPEKEPSTNEIAAGLADALKSQGVSVLDDGDRLLQVVPQEIASTATLGAKDLHSSGGEAVLSGEIDFQGLAVFQVLEIYGQLMGRTRKMDNEQTNLTDPVYFSTTCPLSKPEVIYAFETILRWHHLKVVLNSDNTFSVLNVPTAR